MSRYELVYDIEKLVVIFLEQLISCKRDICKLQTRNSKQQKQSLLECILNCRLENFQRTSLCFYILSEAHNRLVAGDKCTLRELYYKDPAKCCKSTVRIANGLKVVCAILHTTPWSLGILASGKGLIAGAIRFHLINGNVIDCYTQGGAVILPQDHNAIERVETSASFVLVVEKDTVFSKLISQKIFETLGIDIILLTGRGYPDLSTRHIVNRLASAHQLPIYALFDADPFGIEILLIYQFGARKPALQPPQALAQHLICPRMHWIGIHPTELVMFNLPCAPLSVNDNRKLQQLLRYECLKVGVRFELETLQQLQRKVHIDELHSLAQSFLLNDYMPNKIRRNLVI